MQKGKTWPGRLRGWPIAAVGFSMLLIALEPGRCGKIPGLPPWIAARGGTLEPLEHVGILDAFHCGRYKGLVASGSRPYGISDLEAYHLMLCARGSGWGVSVAWETLRYPRYRDDRLAAGVGIESRIPRLCFALETDIRREEIGDYPRISMWRLDGTVLIDCHLAVIAASCPVTGDRNGSPATLGCSAGGDAVAVALNGELKGDRLSGLRSGFRVMFGPSATFMAGYRFETDEISFGLLAHRAGTMVVLSWSHHPVIGQTIALGVGRLWFR